MSKTKTTAAKLEELKEMTAEAPPAVQEPQPKQPEPMTFKKMEDIEIGTRGFYRKGENTICFADVIHAREVRKEWTDEGGTTRSTSKQVLTVIYYGLGVHGSCDTVKDVEVGVQVGQWWHSLKELQGAIRVEYALARGEQPAIAG